MGVTHSYSTCRGPHFSTFYQPVISFSHSRTRHRCPQHWHCSKSTLSEFSQELEIVIGDEHISFTTSKIGSLIDVNQSKWVMNSVVGSHGILVSDKPLNFQNVSLFQGPWRSSRVLLPGARSEMSCIQSHRPTLQDQAHLNVDFAHFNWFSLFLLLYYRICTFVLSGTFFILNKGWQKSATLNVWFAVIHTMP